MPAKKAAIGGLWSAQCPCLLLQSRKVRSTNGYNEAERKVKQISFSWIEVPHKSHLHSISRVHKIMKAQLSTKYSRRQNKEKWGWWSLLSDYSKHELSKSTWEQDQNTKAFELSGKGHLGRWAAFDALVQTKWNCQGPHPEGLTLALQGVQLLWALPHPGMLPSLICCHHTTSSSLPSPHKQGHDCQLPTDLLPDYSSTSMAASGTFRKLPAFQILVWPQPFMQKSVCDRV